MSAIFLSSSGVKQGCNLSPTLANLYQNDLHDIFDDSCGPVSMGNITFNSLSWADDLVLCSTTPQGLQRCLNKLESYSTRWGLTVNERKSKCMTFSTGQNRTPTISHYNDKKLDHVNSFTYLGIDLQSNGKYKSAIQSRICKANRAIFVYKQALKTTGNINTRLSMSIFEKQIVPILTYGCPLWSLPNTTNYIILTGTNNIQQGKEYIYNITGKNIRYSWVRDTTCRRQPSAPCKLLLNIENYEDKELVLVNRHKLPTGINISDNNFDYDSLSYEKVQTNFCKFILNLPRQAGNNACRGEIGKFPLANKMWSLAIKYWHRLERGTDNVFLNNAYVSAKEDNHMWTQQIKSILVKFGMGNIWNNPLAYTTNYVGKTFENRMNDMSMQTWYSSQFESSRFKLQASIHTEYKMSPYLDNMIDIESRNIISRLRLDMNYLNECMFRQKRAASFYCPHCPNIRESVKHFITECPFYAVHRDILYDSLSNTFDREHFSHLIDDNKLSYILNVTDNRHSNAISKFIKTIYEIRKNLQPGVLH